MCLYKISIGLTLNQYSEDNFETHKSGEKFMQNYNILILSITLHRDNLKGLYSNQIFLCL